MTNYLDLFSGIGGFALGAYWAGLRFDNHYFSEVDPYAVKIYQQRFPDAIPLGDITKIDGKALCNSTGERCRETGSDRERSEEWASRASPEWILAGGFPCQDISVAGKGAGITGLRSGLWFHYARLIDEIQPRYAIMENVGALTRRGLDAVLGSLAEIGYDAQWSDIRASDAGAPHRRERIWIVAYPHEIGSCSMPNLRKLEWKRSCFSSQRCRGNIWAIEPDVGRVAHGISSRVDRLKGLGNSIVPEIAEMIFSQPIFNEWRG